ncbi:MAG: DNA mismatch repair protein MutS, partial [Candidatus Thorarchaeota archaeon]
MNSNFSIDNKSNFTPVMQQWIFLKKKYPDYVLFFRMGDFYEFFFEDAEKMSKELDLKLTSRGVDHNNKKIPLAGIPFKALNEYLIKLIEKGIPVAIAEQTPDTRKVGGKEFFGREITQIITPGTITDPELLYNKANNFISCIYISDKVDKDNNNLFGLALIDISTGEFHISEYVEQEMLLNQVFKYLPVEILSSKHTDYDDVITAIKKLISNILVFRIDDYNFDFNQAKKIMIDFYQTHSLDGFGLNNFHAGICAAGALLKVLESRQISLLKKAPQLESSHEYLIIDITARRNLELEQNQREGTIQGTLLWVFDQTHTPMGGRMLRNWLRKPLRDIKTINNRLEAVELLYSDLLIREDLASSLKNFPDIERLTTKLHNETINPREILRLNDGIKKIPKITSTLKKHIKDNANLLNNILNLMKPLPEIISLIDSAIKENAPFYLTDGNIIKPGFDSELDKLHKMKTDGHEWLTEFEQKEQERVNKLLKLKGKKESKLKLSFTRGQGYYLELRSGLPVPDDYRIARSLKDRTRYITDELQLTSSNILNIDEKISELEINIYKKHVILPIKKEINVLNQNSELIANLDVLLTFASLANSYGYTKPFITNNYDLEIKNGRHPVVERILPFGNYIPNSAQMTDSEYVLIITGANMGGKSTYLRQVALIAILAHMGSFVPAEMAKIGILDRIFTRVGVVDDIWRGQSHFMVEMNETSNVLNNATNSSLVILDEIGRGTSTNTGLAIASSVIEYLHSKIKAKTLFATHFHQLNKLESQFAGVKNYHVAIEYDNKKLVFLHKVEPGGTDESYGIEIAQLAGFPNDVVINAKQTRIAIDSNNGVMNTFVEKRDLSDYSDVIQSEQKKLDDSKKFKKKSLKNFLETEQQNKLIKELKDINIEQLTPLEAFKLVK